MLNSINTTAQKYLKELKSILNSHSVLSTPEDIYSYTYDCNCEIKDYEKPLAVVLPSSIEDVQNIVKFCNKYKLPIVPRGAGTNHVGGCVAKNGGIIIHFSKMNKIIEVSQENLYARVQPGAIIGDIQSEVETLGLFFPPDPSNLKVSTIGGAIALSSGGPRGLKYGTTKDYILNLKVILADGSIIETGSDCSKNVTGYNLTQLFVGSEGTLGVIAEATLKLIPKPETNKILLAYFESIEDASKGVNDILEAGIIPSVVDLLDKFTLKTIEEFRPSGINAEKEAMLFIEIDGSDSTITEQEQKIAKILKNADIQFIKTKEQSENFWTARRAAFGATSKLKGNVITEDVAVPRINIPKLVKGIKEINNKYNLTACIMGHAGDGNIHPNYALDFSDTDEMERFYKAKDELFKLALNLGGTLSGEHGIGFEKAQYLQGAIGIKAYSISKQIKQIFDPNNIMNPGKLFIN